MDGVKQAHARSEIDDAGLGDVIDWHLGDATALLPAVSGPLDFILIDLWKDLYIPCFELLRPKLAKNAILVADNMILPPSSRPDANRYQQAVRDSGEFQSVLLPVGSGIELSCRWSSAAVSK